MKFIIRLIILNITHFYFSRVFAPEKRGRGDGPIWASHRDTLVRWSKEPLARRTKGPGTSAEKWRSFPSVAGAAIAAAEGDVLE